MRRWYIPLIKFSHLRNENYEILVGETPQVS